MIVKSTWLFSALEKLGSLSEPKCLTDLIYYWFLVQNFVSRLFMIWMYYLCSTQKCRSLKSIKQIRFSVILNSCYFVNYVIFPFWDILSPSRISFSLQAGPSLCYSNQLLIHCSDFIIIDFYSAMVINVSLFIHFFRHDGTDSPADAGDVIVMLNSFHSKIIKVRVSVFHMYVKRFIALNIIELTVKCFNSFYDAFVFHRS